MKIIRGLIDLFEYLFTHSRLCPCWYCRKIKKHPPGVPLEDDKETAGDD